MNTTRFNKGKTWLLGMAMALAAVSCSKDSNDTSTPEEEVQGKYVIAASNGSATYFLTVNSLDSGSVSIQGNGIENTNTFSHYYMNGTEAMIALKYGQGNPYPGTGYHLNTSGQLEELGNGFDLSGSKFVTAGPVGHYIVTAKAGNTLSDGSTGASFYFIDVDNNNYVTEKSMKTLNIMGNGLEVTAITGIADAGNDTFFATLQLTNGDLDSVYVAKLDYNLNVVATYKDNRLSYSGAQWRSARYAQVGNDDDGNTYVFSSAYSGTTHTAGALRINKGASSFDPDYFFDIQAQAGYQIRRVWHLKADYFLLEVYNETDATTSTKATQYGIARMSTKQFSWISGLPSKEDIYVDAQGATSVGWPSYNTYNGKAYMTLKNLNEDNPFVYVLSVEGAKATKGIEVKGATTIAATGYLTY